MGIEERLVRLERENRRLKMVGLLVLVLAASVFLMGQTRTPQSIEAETFVVRDRRGVKLASFGATYGPNDGSASTITDVAAMEAATRPKAASRLMGTRTARTGATLTLRHEPAWFHSVALIVSACSTASNAVS